MKPIPIIWRVLILENPSIVIGKLNWRRIHGRVHLINGDIMGLGERLIEMSVRWWRLQGGFIA